MALPEASASAVILKIQQLLPTLSKSEQTVASYIMLHPETIINLSMSALAETCAVSEPTVVRACRKLGFSGYQNLKVTLAQSVLAPISAGSEEVTAEDDPQQTIAKVFTATIHTLEFTRDILRTDTLEAVTTMLLEARRIVIFGLGGSGPVAMDLQHKLMRLGLNAVAYTDPHLQAIAASYCEEGDVVFAVSHSGSSRNVVTNTQQAKDRKAKVISLTSLGSSPLTKLADVCLYTASNETKYRIVAISSRIAELAIIDSIYSYMAVRSEGIQSMRVEKAMEDLKY